MPINSLMSFSYPFANLSMSNTAVPMVKIRRGRYYWYWGNLICLEIRDERLAIDNRWRKQSLILQAQISNLHGGSKQ